jgi:DNA-binding GntR family transcriptional regulator
VWATVRRAKVHLDRVRRLSLPLPEVMGHLIEQHEAVVDAVQRRDVDAAEAALREHLGEVLRSLAALSDRRPEYFVAPGAVAVG